MLNYFERGLVPDWFRIGSGLVPDWIRIGGLTYNPGWIGSGFKILNPLRPLIRINGNRMEVILKYIIIINLYFVEMIENYLE